MEIVEIRWQQNVRQGQKFILLRKRRFQNILRIDDGKGDIFKMPKQMARTNQDVVGEKCIRNGDLAFEDLAKVKAWKNYYSLLLYEEFE